jgi:hypothetical protein
MRKATRIVATVTGITAGLAGIEHGVFEILHNAGRPENWMFASMGAPCDPLIAWNGCEPAMSVIPSFVIMGIVTILLGTLLAVWSGFFVQRKSGGWVSLLLSVLLLLSGGGFFPPVIGLFSGFVGNAINRPLKSHKVNGITRFTSRLWPWPLVYFPVWGIGQFIIGALFNDFLKSNMIYFTVLFMVMLPLMIVSAHSHDVIYENNHK